jgi:proline iminopeptidase
MSTSKLYIDPAHVAAAEKDDWAKFARFVVGPNRPWLILFKTSAFARIENHYFIKDAFMRDGQLLDSQEIDKM